MKFKSKLFLDGDQATRIALYLRSTSPKAKRNLFKSMSPEAKIAAIKMEKEQKKRLRPTKKRKTPLARMGGTFRGGSNPLTDNTMCQCGGYKYADADCCQNCSNAQRGWI